VGFFIGVVLEIVLYEKTIAPPGKFIDFGDPGSFTFITIGAMIAWLLLSWLERLSRAMLRRKNAGA
jgi:hypothetical protein